MGQQQLLLIVLSVIIVGVAVAVGVTQFKTSAVDANRQAVIGDLVNLAAKAQRYFRTPEQLGGGGGDFVGFDLSSLEALNANGAYTISDSTSNATTIDIQGTGTEIEDGTPVQATVTVTADVITTVIDN